MEDQNGKSCICSRKEGWCRRIDIRAGGMACLFLLACVLAALTKGSPAAAKKISPVEEYGTLQLKDYDHDQSASTPKRRQLCDEKGNLVQLKGMSTFGLQWKEGDWILKGELFDVLAYDWHCDVVRLAMYVNEGGYREHPEELLNKVEKGIRLAIERGMYVIVDWHVLSPGDPSDASYLTAGKGVKAYAKIQKKHPDYTGPQLFFAYLSEKYGGYDNVLWEICNEPNGLGSEGDSGKVWKKKLLPYCQSIVDVIREYDADGEDNIIICGTDQWSQLIDAPKASPVKDKNNQVMYAMHFYAGTHDTGNGKQESRQLRERVEKALDSGLAVFCTEWGTSQASGDGGPFLDYAKRWLSFLDRNGISWCNWSLSKKAESASAFLPGARDSGLKDTDGDQIPNWKTKTELSESGRFLREVLRKGNSDATGSKDQETVKGDKSKVILAYRFQNGGISGFHADGNSQITTADLKIRKAETKAISFAVTFRKKKNTWEDGARLSTPFFTKKQRNLTKSQKVKFVSLDLYLLCGKIKSGTLLLTICPIPDGEGYWHQLKPVKISLAKGKKVIGANNRKLLKYTLKVPLSENGKYPFSVRLRNLIFVLQNQNSSYKGMVYLDNIRLLS